MSKNWSLRISVCVLILLGVATCQAQADLANPASVFCDENGGMLEIRTGEDGGQVGYCVFEGASECEEWAFFRGECTPGDSLNDQANLANPASVFCEENQGRLEIRTDDSGSQTGFCLFENGSECEEWAFFRGECQAEN